MPASPLRARMSADAVWTGTQMIVWGGRSLTGAQGFLNGASFTPATLG